MRAPFVIGATIAGVAGIIAFHPHASTGAVTFTSPGARPVGGTSTKGGAASSGAPPTSGPAPSSTTTTAAGAPPGPAAPVTTATAGTPPPSSHAAPVPTAPPPTMTATTSPPATTASATASGSVTQYRFGVLQVTATVSAGRITNVSTQVQSADPHSQQIDDAALPVLRAQVLSAQGANIQGVSGATYTSQAFVSSLQSALSALGFTG